MANAALQNQGHNSPADQRLEIVNRTGQSGKITQGFTPALSREQYTIGPDGRATVRKAGGIGFLPVGGAK